MQQTEARNCISILSCDRV